MSAPLAFALVCAAGGAGAMARFAVDGAVRARWRTSLPAGTVVVNVTGSLLAGLLTGAAVAGALGGPAATVAVTGFCGGYTTFSTAMADTVRLARAGDVRAAVLNAVGTAALTVAAAAGGLATAVLVC